MRNSLKAHIDINVLIKHHLTYDKLAFSIINASSYIDKEEVRYSRIIEREHFYLDNFINNMYDYHNHAYSIDEIKKEVNRLLECGILKAYTYANRTRIFFNMRYYNINEIVKRLAF